jgi:hypothetical protein
MSPTACERSSSKSQSRLRAMKEISCASSMSPASRSREGGLLARGEARHEEWRNAHVQVARGARDGLGDLARGLDRERRFHRPTRKATVRPACLRRALHGERRRAQHVVHEALPHALYPRWSATTPAARLK